MASPQPAFGDYQLEIYGAGLQGVVPTFPMAFAEPCRRRYCPTSRAARAVSIPSGPTRPRSISGA